MNYLILFQARTGSSRLPGKVLLPFYKDKCILEIILDRFIQKFPKVALRMATTEMESDDPIAEMCKTKGISCFRGSESDVLGRFIQAAEGTDIVGRVCCDNPFIDVESMHRWASSVDDNTDYLSYCNEEKTPAIKTHWGIFGEIVTYQALTRVERSTNENLYREHVTNYIYSYPDQFSVKLEEAPLTVRSRNDLRFTVDTETDFKNMAFLYAKAMDTFGKCPGIDQLINLADQHPKVLAVMQRQIAQNSK